MPLEFRVQTYLTVYWSCSWLQPGTRCPSNVFATVNPLRLERTQDTRKNLLLGFLSFGPNPALRPIYYHPKKYFRQSKFTSNPNCEHINHILHKLLNPKTAEGRRRQHNLNASVFCLIYSWCAHNLDCSEGRKSPSLILVKDEDTNEWYKDNSI